MSLSGGWAAWLAARQEIKTPDGWRSEITKETILLWPPPDPHTSQIVARVRGVLADVAGQNWVVREDVEVPIPSRLELFAPDVVVAATTGRPRLVAEITSQDTVELDRRTKRRGYAHAGVPQYLLVDRFEEGCPSVTLLSEPADGRYRRRHTVPFGEKIHLPEPFDLDLDTSEF